MWPQRKIAVICFLSSLAVISTLSLNVKAGGEMDLSGRRNDGIFESFFPDDLKAGKRLDEYWKNRTNSDISEEEFFALFRKGLRQCTVEYKGSVLMQYIGGKYIWHKEPDDPTALDIVYHASFDDKYKYYAVYSGLSTANPKSERVLKRLVELAMEPYQLGRIIWGVKSSNQQDEFMRMLTPYLDSDDSAIRERAEIVAKAMEGKIDADKWEHQWKQRQHQQETLRKFGDELPRIKDALINGSSKDRLAALNFVRSNNITLSVDNDFLGALDACSRDDNAKVRSLAARAVGNNFILGWENQPDEAIEIVMRLSADKNRDVRYKAVYFGLSTIDEKSNTVVERLIDIALTDDEHNMYSRCCWALRNSKTAKAILKRHYDHRDYELRKIGKLHYDIFHEDIAPEETAQARARAAENLESSVNLDATYKLSFEESIEALKASLDEQQDIIVLWRDLERVGINRDTVINMEPLESVPLKTALKLLLNATAGGDDILDYTVIDGVIVIATQRTIQKFLPQIRVYDITDLTRVPAEYFSR